MGLRGCDVREKEPTRIASVTKSVLDGMLGVEVLLDQIKPLCCADGVTTRAKQLVA
jgi:hypothetical protein